MALSGRPYADEYYECLNKLRGIAEESIEVIVKAELENERADSPVEKKRAKIYKMYPHIKTLCLDNINIFLKKIDYDFHF